MERPAVLALALVALTGCRVEIIHDVDEPTANEVLAALNSQGIAGTKERDVQGSKASYTVAVPRGEAAEAWKVLRAQNLPRPATQGLGEVFGNTGLVPTATQERALMRHALSGELARTLQSVDGVLEARVHLVLPTRDPLAPPDARTSEAKASVLLRVAGKSTLSREEVQRLVAGSVKGLAAEHVSVVTVREPPPVSGASAELRTLGPFSVASDSRTSLLVTLVVGLILLALLGTGTIVLLRRNRQLAARAAQLAEARSRDTGVSSSRLEGSLGLIERSLNARSRSRAIGEGRDNS